MDEIEEKEGNRLNRRSLGNILSKKNACLVTEKGRYAVFCINIQYFKNFFVSLTLPSMRKPRIYMSLPFRAGDFRNTK